MNKLTDKLVTVDSSNDVGELFVKWLSDNGYDAELGDANLIDGVRGLRSDDDTIDIHNELWNQYCND